MNKPNKHGLKTLLKYRKSIEEQRKMELTNLMDKEQIEHQKLNDIKESQRLMQKKLHTNKEKSCTYIAYLDGLSDQFVMQKNAIIDIKDKIITKREQVIEASMAKKIIEKAQDKRVKEYNQFLIKQENKILDEMATNRYSRKDN
jgi:flagellar export protein FliJ